MTLVQSVKACFWKYATFSGRAPLSEFWKFALFLLLAQVFLIIVNSMLFGPEVIVKNVVDPSASGAFKQTTIYRYSSGMLGMILMLATIVPMLAVTWRRMHDIGRPGWMSFAPTLAAISLTVLAFVAFGVTETHAYGSNTRLPNLIGWPVALALFGALVLQIVWLASKSQPGTNPYGPNPSEATP